MTARSAWLTPPAIKHLAYRGGAWYGISTGKTNPRGVATDGTNQFWGCGNGYGSIYYNANTGADPIQFQNIALTSAVKVRNNTVYTTVKGSESVNLYPAGIYSFVDFFNNPVSYPRCRFLSAAGGACRGALHQLHRV